MCSYLFSRRCRPPVRPPTRSSVRPFSFLRSFFFLFSFPFTFYLPFPFVPLFSLFFLLPELLFSSLSPSFLPLNVPRFRRVSNHRPAERRKRFERLALINPLYWLFFTFARFPLIPCRAVICLSIYICNYIYTYIEREREVHRGRKINHIIKHDEMENNLYPVDFPSHRLIYWHPNDECSSSSTVEDVATFSVYKSYPVTFVSCV